MHRVLGGAAGAREREPVHGHVRQPVPIHIPFEVLEDPRVGFERVNRAVGTHETCEEQRVLADVRAAVQRDHPRAQDLPKGLGDRRVGRSIARGVAEEDTGRRARVGEPNHHAVDGQLERSSREEAPVEPPAEPARDRPDGVVAKPVAPHEASCARDDRVGTHGRDGARSARRARLSWRRSDSYGPARRPPRTDA